MGTTSPRRVIGVAASAGGVEALRTLVSRLPADLDAAVCVVLHIPPTGRSLLAPILDRDTTLHAVVAEHGMELRAGTIYVAPTDHHLLVREDRVELSRAPKENGVRPAADPLFRSIARAWGPNGTAVVLTGSLDDGAAGAVAVGQAGGRILVQHPDDAIAPSMPSAALAVTTPDAVLPISALAEWLASPPAFDQPAGLATGFACPECDGALWELREGELTRYRCRVGHAYSEEAIVDVTRTRVESGAREAAERAEIIRRVLAHDHQPAA